MAGANMSKGLDSIERWAIGQRRVARKLRHVLISKGLFNEREHAGLVKEIELLHEVVRRVREAREGTE